MIPTLFGITVICFLIINLAPGSPVEQKIQQIRFGGAGQGEGRAGADRSGSGVSQEVIEALKKQYGFDKPVHERYWIWLKNIVRLDFGDSFTYEEPVITVILRRIPISLQFGVASFILTYLICIPLGVFKAIRNNSTFDFLSSIPLFAMYSTPPVMLAILLIIFFAGGNYLDIFPIGDLYSDNYQELSSLAKIGDRIHHFVLPLTCYVIGSFATLTQLVKTSMLDVIKQDYVRMARAKGLSESVVYFKHALRNALIPIATGIGGFLGVFFAGSLIIETIFQLDGMGSLGFKSIMSRDYNVIMGLLFIQSIIMLLGRLLSDLTYVLVDPRIDFQ